MESRLAAVKKATA